MGGLLLNVALRLHLLYFLTEVLRRPGDPRFAGKALPVRNALVVGGARLVFPALHLLRRPRGRRGRGWGRYPVWLDALYLSIFWLDMAGNSLDLYDRYAYFDLLPHAHGTGAATVVLRAVLGLPTLSAVGLATVLHLLLEAQEARGQQAEGQRAAAEGRDEGQDARRQEVRSPHHGRLVPAHRPERRHPARRPPGKPLGEALCPAGPGVS
jgi:hypothetical protein